MFIEAYIDKLKQRLTSGNWESILHDSTNDNYEAFLKTFTDIYDEFIPCKKKVFQRRKELKSPWTMKGLLKSITHTHTHTHKQTNKQTNKIKTKQTNKLYQNT